MPAKARYVTLPAARTWTFCLASAVSLKLVGIVQTALPVLVLVISPRGPPAAHRLAMRGGGAAASRTEDCHSWSAPFAPSTALDDLHVFVEESGKRQFLVTLWQRCPEMRFGRAQLRSRAITTVCPESRASIRFSDGLDGYQCEIRNIERGRQARGEAEAVRDDRLRHGD